MDFLLIVLGIGGLVFAGVMLVLASRASRMERESDARVQTLQALAIGNDAPLQPGSHPFVMTVPAGGGRVPGGFSFDRTPRRSQT